MCLSAQIPKKGKIYSVNEGNAKNWDRPTTKYVEFNLSRFSTDFFFYHFVTSLFLFGWRDLGMLKSASFPKMVHHQSR
jgi:hypothetical protein